MPQLKLAKAVVSKAGASCAGLRAGRSLRQVPARVVKAGDVVMVRVKRSTWRACASASPCADIITELEKPGRDPRPEFKTATFKEGVKKITDLKPGIQLEGVVTNVAVFGAFVDIGVHHDGLMHVSELADRFVKDPHEAPSPPRCAQDR
jgi:transcriptional accessory protein Tex/SPT6